MKLPRLGRPSLVAGLRHRNPRTGRRDSRRVVGDLAGPVGQDRRVGRAGQGGHGAARAAGKRGKRGKRGPQGPVGATGKAGKDGTNGVNGTNGLNGTALGYATVSGGLTLIPGGSFNVTQANVVPVDIGYTCFANLPFTPKVATVSLTHPVTTTINSNVNTLQASVRVGPDPLCPGPEASVVVNNTAGTRMNGEFQIVLN